MPTIGLNFERLLQVGPNLAQVIHSVSTYRDVKVVIQIGGDPFFGSGLMIGFEKK
jgi:hypothetical protein